AARAAREANQLKLAVQRQSGRIHDPANDQRFVDSTIAAFGREFFDRLAGAGIATRRPVFIVGLPRSGTTLIEQILASHSEIHGAGELFLARKRYVSIPSVLGLGKPPRDCVADLDAAAIKKLADQHLSDL